MTQLVFWFAAIGVSLMATVFVWRQVRQLMSAVKWAYQTKNYTMAFWSSFAVIVLLFCLFAFGLAMIDMIDGRFDILREAS